MAKYCMIPIEVHPQCLAIASVSTTFNDNETIQEIEILQTFALIDQM